MRQNYMLPRIIGLMLIFTLTCSTGYIFTESQQEPEVSENMPFEGYVDTNGVFHLEILKTDESMQAHIPVLRQGYEILKQPTWKKKTTGIINRIKGRGADEGCMSASEETQWTEGQASSWTGTNITVSDESGAEYVQKGNYCIKLAITGGLSGWSDDFNDSSINSSYWDTDEEGSGWVQEGYRASTITAWASPTNGHWAFFCLDATQELSGDYDINFTANNIAGPAGQILYMCFITSEDFPAKDWSGPRLWTSTSSSSTLYLYDGNSTTELVSNPGSEFTIRIVRSDSTVTIYYDGEQKWSGSFTEDTTHDNLQFGVSPSGAGNRDVNLDVFNHNLSTTGGDALTPSFTKNLDRYSNLFCYYRQDGSTSFSIRLETDASNYFEWSLTPQKVNESYELRLPVGSASSGWSETGSPDWTNITQIRFVYPASGNISTAYIDKLYFTVVPIEAEYEDEDSQTTYGIYECSKYVNKSITSVAQLETTLETIVNASNNQHELVEIIIYGSRVYSVNQLVYIDFPKAGINMKCCNIREVEYLLGTMTLTRLFCQDLDSVNSEIVLHGLVKHLKQQQLDIEQTKK